MKASTSTIISNQEDSTNVPTGHNEDGERTITNTDGNTSRNEAPRDNDDNTRSILLSTLSTNQEMNPMQRLHAIINANRSAGLNDAVTGCFPAPETGPTALLSLVPPSFMLPEEFRRPLRFQSEEERLQHQMFLLDSALAIIRGDDDDDDNDDEDDEGDDNLNQ